MGIKLALGAISTMGIIAGGSYSAYIFSIPKTIGSQLTRNLRTLINTDLNNSEHNEKIKELITEYKKDTNNNKIEGLVINSDENTNINNLKNKCKELFEKDNVKENQKDLENAGLWCVIKS